MITLKKVTILSYILHKLLCTFSFRHLSTFALKREKKVGSLACLSHFTMNGKKEKKFSISLRKISCVTRVEGFLHTAFFPQRLSSFYWLFSLTLMMFLLSRSCLGHHDDRGGNDGKQGDRGPHVYSKSKIRASDNFSLQLKKKSNLDRRRRSIDTINWELDTAN